MKVDIEQDNYPSRGFEIKVSTFTGDGDMYHDFTKHIPDDQALLYSHVFALAILNRRELKKYLELFQEETNYIGTLDDEWFIDWDSSYADSLNYYKVFHHDGFGKVSKVNVELTEAEKEEVEKVLNKG
jgi:hypothetical protein